MCDVLQVLAVQFDETETQECGDVESHLSSLLIVFEDDLVQGVLVD